MRYIVQSLLSFRIAEAIETNIKKKIAKSSNLLSIFNITRKHTISQGIDKITVLVTPSYRVSDEQFPNSKEVYK